MNAQNLIDTARTLVAGEKGLLAMDESRDCLGRWRFRLPAPYSNRPWRFGKARRPTYWRHSKLCIIGPGVTGLRAVANTMPGWKGHEHDSKCARSRVAGDWRLDSRAPKGHPSTCFMPGGWRLRF
jgi:hypothetical protein